MYNYNSRPVRVKIYRAKEGRRRLSTERRKGGEGYQEEWEGEGKASDFVCPDRYQCDPIAPDIRALVILRTYLHGIDSLRLW